MLGGFRRPSERTDDRHSVRFGRVSAGVNEGLAGQENSRSLSDLPSNERPKGIRDRPERRLPWLARSATLAPS
jgi:hypothetical protein